MPCIITGFLPKSSSSSVPTSMSKMLKVFSTVAVILIPCYCLPPILQSLLPPQLFIELCPTALEHFPCLLRIRSGDPRKHRHAHEVVLVCIQHCLRYKVGSYNASKEVHEYRFNFLDFAYHF